MKTVIEMAREAGLDYEQYDSIARVPVYIALPNELERFAQLVRADEREACAKVCDDIEQAKNFSGPMHCAASIRARSNT